MAKITRSYDAEAVTEIVADYNYDVDIEKWIEDDKNIVLTDGEGSYGLLEYVKDGIYTPHYFFTVRGKEAKALATEMRDVIFNDYPVQVLRGLTPLQHKAARWMTRQMGFTSYGAVTTILGPCELFILTKQEYQRIK